MSCAVNDMGIIEQLTPARLAPEQFFSVRPGSGCSTPTSPLTP